MQRSTLNAQRSTLNGRTLFRWTLSLCPLLLGMLLIAATAPATAPATKPAPQTWYYSAAGSDVASGLDAAHAKKTPKFAGNTNVFLNRGDMFAVTMQLSNLTDITVNAFGDAAKGKPVIYAPTGGNCTAWWYGTARIAIRNVRFDSAWVWTKTAGGYAYHQPAAAFGNVRGSDILIQDCDLANLNEGVELESCQRVQIVRLTQVDPLGLTARNIMVLDATDTLIQGCVMLNSINESPLRSTGKGFQGTTIIAGNKISQVLDPAHGRTACGDGQVKAAVTIRAASGQCSFVGNQVGPGNLSLNTDVTGLQTINATVIGNVVSNAQLEIRSGATGCVISGNDVTAPKDSAGNSLVPCMPVSADPKSANQINANVLHGNRYGGIKFFSPSNASVNANVYLGSSPDTACVTGTAGATVGGNVIVGEK